jgi:hypothetical protein
MESCSRQAPAVGDDDPVRDLRNKDQICRVLALALRRC